MIFSEHDTLRRRACMKRALTLVAIADCEPSNTNVRAASIAVHTLERVQEEALRNVEQYRRNCMMAEILRG
jgi:hypothetical protein